MKNQKYLSDYEAYTEQEISEVSPKDITLRNGMHIDFSECAKVWAEVNSLDITTCVGERDITDLSFTFYCLPKPIMIKFIKKGKMYEKFSKRNASYRFHELQNKISEYGFTTFDMS